MFLNLVKRRLIRLFVMLVFTSFSFTTSAADKATIEKIKDKMEMLKIQVTSITPSAVDGLYEILTAQGVYYISENAQFLVHGSIYDLDNKMENLSEKSLITLRNAHLKDFEGDMITYKAPDQKHVITVFTDTSCVYCQKLHAEMADYHKFGITVRYLAFPRGGLKSSTYHSMVSIWCADDKKLAMDSTKTRRPIEPKTCKNTVKEQYELGLSFGVTGTPAILLEDGSLKPGYIPAGRLAQMLENK